LSEHPVVVPILVVLIYPRDHEVPGTVTADRRALLLTGGVRIHPELSSDRRSVARKALREDVVAQRIAFRTVPHHDEAAITRAAYGRRSLISGRVGVDLELGPDWRRHLGHNEASHQQPTTHKHWTEPKPHGVFHLRLIVWSRSASQVENRPDAGPANSGIAGPFATPV
jgi:hypothetical protein